ncbi:hypothetical protein [Enterovirga sp. CN4-39]|uniref:hypothetical protein n=1 Tax=Enterovirga sp. CN4-39 TaxID=3400910 RepID=UPI003C00D0F7
MPELTREQRVKALRFANARAGYRLVLLGRSLAEAIDNPRYLPKLAGECVRNSDDPQDGFATKEEAMAAARRYRESCRLALSSHDGGAADG